MLDLKHPNLGTVLAYCTLGPADEIARVERAAHNRMRKESGWTGWRVAEVGIEDEEDDLVRMSVRCEPMPNAYAEPFDLIFLMDALGRRRSPRLDAFFHACGIRERCDDTREIQGRFFATRNGAAAVSDFAPLDRALS